MAIPNKTNLQTMDYSYMGVPYVQVASKSGIDLDGLDYSFFGQPFYGAEEPVVAKKESPLSNRMVALAKPYRTVLVTLSSMDTIDAKLF